jgi:hypothetical protein
VRVSWIGVKGLDKEQVLGRLGFVETDDQNKARLSYAEQPSGWIIIYSNDEGWASPHRVATLSQSGSAVGCQMSEVVMCSAACGCQGGVRQWSVTHDPEKGEPLKIDGEPPAEFVAIRDRLFREQEQDDSVDYIFDVPIALTAALCGFRPDEPGPEPEPFFVLIAPAKGGGSTQRPGAFNWLGKIFSKT